MNKLFNDGYIDADKLEMVDKINKLNIINNWTFVQNVHTKKKYYIIPSNKIIKNNMREELLKVACEHQPETYQERLLRELNQD
tara:strand:+ start:116 stop:364 length:249 start_codon:yes stop_codon:yes gene_type:complete